MKTTIGMAALAVIGLAAWGARSLGAEAIGEKAENAANSVYGFSVKTNDGSEALLSAYEGKALLIVNTASKCGFTPQYESLETLYERYRDRGFEVLAFPANDFGKQEPGSNAEIREFCSAKYGVTFPLFAKIRVVGDDMDPLYRFLTTRPGFAGEITWNFNKFLVDPKGAVVARFDSSVDPLSKDVLAKLESVLPATPGGKGE